MSQRGTGQEKHERCSNSVMTCAGAASVSHLRTLTDALMISPSLYVKSSSLRIAQPSTAILGQMGRGGMGRALRIIHSGRAYASERPSKKRSQYTIWKTVYTSEDVMTLLLGCRDFTSSSSCFGFLCSLNVNTLPPSAPRDGFEKDSEIVHVDHEM